MRIALIGMMGTLKSSVGKELSKSLALPLFDTDDIFIKENDISINDAFKNFGEEFFRNKETEIIRKLCNLEDIIISCGGGLPVRGENRQELSKCFCVRLTAAAQTIFGRLKRNKTRPLLKDISVERIDQLIKDREQVYASAANVTFVTDGKTAACISTEIINIIKKISR